MRVTCADSVVDACVCLYICSIGSSDAGAKGTQVILNPDLHELRAYTTEENFVRVFSFLKNVTSSSDVARHMDANWQAELKTVRKTLKEGCEEFVEEIERSVLSNLESPSSYTPNTFPSTRTQMKRIETFKQHPDLQECAVSVLHTLRDETSKYTERARNEGMAAMHSGSGNLMALKQCIAILQDSKRVFPTIASKVTDTLTELETEVVVCTEAIRASLSKQLDPAVLLRTFKQVQRLRLLLDAKAFAHRNADSCDQTNETGDIDVDINIARLVPEKAESGTRDASPLLDKELKHSHNDGAIATTAAATKDATASTLAYRQYRKVHWKELDRRHNFSAKMSAKEKDHMAMQKVAKSPCDDSVCQVLDLGQPASRTGAVELALPLGLKFKGSAEEGYVVLSVTEGGNAHQAGVLASMRILRVNDAPLDGLDKEQVAAMLKSTRDPVRLALEPFETATIEGKIKATRDNLVKAKEQFAAETCNPEKEKLESLLWRQYQKENVSRFKQQHSEHDSFATSPAAR